MPSSRVCSELETIIGKSRTMAVLQSLGPLLAVSIFEIHQGARYRVTPQLYSSSFPLLANTFHA